MLTTYHRWRHTGSTPDVERDFAVADVWLRQLAQLRTPHVERTAWAPALIDRWRDERDIDAIYRSVVRLEERLTCRSHQSLLHGDFWCGNVLQQHGAVTGVVDWEHSVAGGDPLRDRARFALSYALYLDRHTRRGRAVRGHPGLIAGRWGDGVRHAFAGRCWCSNVIEEFLGAGLVATGRTRSGWRDALILGLAEIATRSDDRQFARNHLRLCAELGQRA